MSFDYGKQGPDGQYERYPTLDDERNPIRPIRKTYLHEKCGITTMMGDSIAKTYAIAPGYYGSTYCIACQKHYPIGANGEFTWMEGGKDTGIKVGT